jgi:hypothetical protein
VIAPEPDDGINPQTSRGPLRPLLLKALALSAFLFALLELWRPYYFLTDDNLDGGFPAFTEIGQNLLAGRSPFITQHLFGGGYNMLRDPNFFAWNPIYLLVSLLAGTPFHLAILEVDAFIMMMLATAGFLTLAHHVRRRMGLSISDRWILFYALSYVYSMIVLTTGASWLTFLGNVASLPWLALGILLPSWWRGTLLVALFSANQILGGHPEPTISTTVYLSLFALGLAVAGRSITPVLNWGLGSALAGLVLLPLLLPMLDGFGHTLRAGGVPLDDMQANNIPAIDFPTSVLLGMAIWLAHPNDHPYVTYTLALGSCAAAWCLIPAVASRAKWRPLDGVLLGLLIFGAVLIIRPRFISEIMLHLPLFRSMRWPFREFVQFQFVLHLFLVARPPGLNANARLASALFGSFVYIVPLVLFPFPPTFNTMTWDRELLISGGYEKYWAQVRPLLQPGDRVAVLIPFKLYSDDRFEEPYILLGSYNYAEIDGFINAWGYSPTAVRDQVYTTTYAYYPFGAYDPAQKPALMAEKPDLKFITLESLHPLKITLSSRDGPTIDLTPFVPRRTSRIPPHERGLP